MTRFKEHPISSVLGLIFIAFGFVLFFIPTQFDFPNYTHLVAWVFGILLLKAEDKLIAILTLGLSTLIKDINNKIK
jgi:hypothetical protein